MKKLMSLIFVLLLLTSSLSVNAVCPGDLDCSPADNFAGDSSLANFNSLPNPTVNDFQQMNSIDQATYLNGNYRGDFAEDFFEREPLIKAEKAADNYLKDKFSSSSITFKVVDGMEYSEEKGLCIGDRCLTTKEGTSDSIPGWASEVGFDKEKDQFIFEPRVSIEGNVEASGDGIFTLESGTTIYDQETGAILYTAQGDTKLKFIDGGFSIEGKSSGEWTDIIGHKNSFVNFAGKLTISPVLITCDNCKVDYQGSEINGKFIASLANGRLRHVSLRDSSSSYKDSFGKLVGESNIEFDEKGNWNYIETIGPSQAEFDKKFITGEFEAFFDNGKIQKARLISQESYFKDHKSNLKVYHNSKAANIFFGDFSKATMSALSHNLEESYAFALSNKRLYGKGKIGLETSTFDYESKQNAANFIRGFSKKGENILINSEEEGDVARLTKKAEIGKLLQEKLFRKESGEITSNIQNKDGKLSIVLDKESLKTFAAIREDRNRFMVADSNLFVGVGDKDASLSMSDDLGMLYIDGQGKTQILGSDNVFSAIGRKLVDINLEINKLKLDLATTKKTGDPNLNKLLKTKDSLEFLVHQDDIQGEISTNNFDASIAKTQQFLEEHPDSPIIAKIKHQIGEFYAGKAMNIKIGESSQGTLSLGGETYPLQYRTKFNPNTGKEEVTAWSPDGQNWMKLDQTVVKGGKWDGVAPTEQNVKLIQRLRSTRGDMNILSKVANERGVSLTGTHSNPSQGYQDSVRAYEQAIEFYKESKLDPEVTNDAAIALGGIYLKIHKSEQAEQEYQSLTSSENAKTASVGYMGLAMVTADKGALKTSLQHIAKARAQDPENAAAKSMQLQLQSGVLDAIDNALSTESRGTLKAFERKLGLEEYEGEVLDYMGQVIGNTGRIITDPVTGFSKDLVIIQEGVQAEISAQQAGIMILKLANKNGITLQKMQEMGGNQREKLITSLTKTEDFDRVTFLNAGLGSALGNSDVRLATQNGRLTNSQLINYRDALARGEIAWHGLSYNQDPEVPDLMSGNFRFKTGEGYVNKKGLEFTWRDSVFEGVDIKNAALIALPMAKAGVASGTSLGIFAKSAQGVAYAQKLGQAKTVAGALVGTLIKGGEKVIGAERAARLAKRATTLRHTVASSKVGQFLTTEYGAGGLLDKSVSFFGRLGAEEAGEELLGYGAGNVIGIVKPEWAASANILTSTLVGHGQVFDGALEGLGSAAKTARTSGVRRMIFSEGGEVLGEVADTFTSKSVRDQFISNIRKSAGESFEDLGEGVFKLDGKTYYAALEGAELPTIPGKTVVGAADIDTNSVQETIEVRFEEAKAAFKSESPDVLDSIDRRQIVVDERGFGRIENPDSDGTIDELITASREEFGHLERSIKQNHFDEIAHKNKNYVAGSEDAVDALRKSGGEEVTVAYFESSKLTHANSLRGGHDVGNDLVRETNHVIKGHFEALDPNAIVFRGPNGAVIVQSKVLSKQDISGELRNLERKITSALPEDYPDRGVTGALRLGTTTINPTEGLDRNAAKALYYKALQESGAAAEFIKSRPHQSLLNPGKPAPTSRSMDFQEVTAGKSTKELDKFLFENHNFIPPEAETGTLFIMRDQLDTVDQLRREVSSLENLLESGDTSITTQLKTLTEQRDAEATKLIAMFKRPSRFEANVDAVFKGEQVPILNFKAAENLQERLIKDGVPFYRADGDLDHLRDVFKTYKVTGADSHYAAFYTESAKALRAYEDTNPGVRAFMSKQSSSDEFSLVITGASKQQVEEVMETTRKAMESVGKKQTFEKIHKVTMVKVDPEGVISGTTTTLASTLEPITSSSQLKTIAHTNDEIVNLRKYIPGKNTVGSFESITPQQAEGIMDTFRAYQKVAKTDLDTAPLSEIKESLKAHRRILEQKGIPRKDIDNMLSEIDQGLISIPRQRAHRGSLLPGFY